MFLKTYDLDIRVRFPCPARKVLAGVLCMALITMPIRAMADELLVFAAASLNNALTAVADAWMSSTGHVVAVSFAGTSALANQIIAGAPADIFISSNSEWMDAVAASGDLRDGTRRDILGNTLVLVAHGQDAAPVIIDETLDLGGMLGGDRLAMALVEAVPAGIYGKAALSSLGLWDAVQSSVAQFDNVRSALAFVALNEAPLGIVYATDAGVERNVTIIGTFPAGSHAPITYPAAITAQSTSTAAEDFLAFLTSDTARAIWESYGFRVID